MAKTSLAVYGTMIALLIGFGIWLALDLADGRTRIVSERLALAVQKSQFMSQWFGTTIVASDYVLRDINEKVVPEDLSAHVSDPQYFEGLNHWLEKKLATVSSAVGAGVYDSNCVFRAAADRRIVGIRSNQAFCADPTMQLEDKLYIQYVPAEKSANNQPSILVSRQHLSPDGRLLGGALIAIQLSKAQEWLMAFTVDPGDVMSLVDSEGTLLARNPPLPEAIGTRFVNWWTKRSLGEERFSVSYTSISPVDGRERIYGLSKIEKIPLVVLVGFDLNRALAEWHRRAWQISAGFLALLVVSAAALRAHRIVLLQRDELRTLATTDPLTGVANRRQLIQAGENEVSRALRYGRRMAVIMVDIDNFKSVNDTWGHPTGDRVIQSLAEAMVAATREQDVVGRLGGEEFAAILLEADRQGVCAIAERLRQSVQDSIAALSDDGQTVRVTVSVGSATLEPDDKAFKDVLGRADKALYVAKTGGRNQVVIM